MTHSTSKPRFSFIRDDLLEYMSVDGDGVGVVVLVTLVSIDRCGCLEVGVLGVSDVLSLVSRSAI